MVKLMGMGDWWLWCLDICVFFFKMYTWYYCYDSSLSSSFFLLWYCIVLSCCCYYCFLIPLPVPESELRRWTPNKLQAPWPSSCEASVFVRGACFAFSALFQLIGATEELGYKRHITISLDPMCCKDLQSIDTNDTNRSMMISLYTLWWITTSCNLL